MMTRGQEEIGGQKTPIFVQVCGKNYPERGKKGSNCVHVVIKWTHK